MWRPLRVENTAPGRPWTGLVILEKEKEGSLTLLAKPGGEHLTQQVNSLKKLFWIKLETWDGKTEMTSEGKTGEQHVLLPCICWEFPLEKHSHIPWSSLVCMGCVTAPPGHSHKSCVFLVDDSKWLRHPYISIYLRKQLPSRVKSYQGKHQIVQCSCRQKEQQDGKQQRANK